MHFGEPIDDDRFAALLRPGKGIATFLMADKSLLGETLRLRKEGRKWRLDV